jgi:hypothetical protein
MIRNEIRYDDTEHIHLRNINRSPLTNSHEVVLLLVHCSFRRFGLFLRHDQDNVLCPKEYGFVMASPPSWRWRKLIAFHVCGAYVYHGKRKKHNSHHSSFCPFVLSAFLVVPTHTTTCLSVTLDQTGWCSTGIDRRHRFSFRNQGIPIGGTQNTHGYTRIAGPALQ